MGGRSVSLIDYPLISHDKSPGTTNILKQILPELWTWTEFWAHCCHFLCLRFLLAVLWVEWKKGGPVTPITIFINSLTTVFLACATNILKTFTDTFDSERRILHSESCAFTALHWSLQELQHLTILEVWLGITAAKHSYQQQTMTAK